MRKLFLFFCCILCAQLYSQTNYVFNVELNDKSNAPIFVKNGNELIYIGNDPVESAFFSNYIITNFFPTYPNYSGYLVNVFTFNTKSSTLMDDLKTSFPTKYLRTENLTGMELKLLSSYYPNDYGNGQNYYNPEINLGANLSMKSFDYVNAPKAWGFFDYEKGNVTIGISDGMVNDLDEDLEDKVNYIQPNLFNSNFVCDPIGFEARHGTTTASIAAAKGDNGHGIAGICYDCKIINAPYSLDVYSSNVSPNFPGLMEMALNGVRVINMSWSRGPFSDPSYVTGFIQSEQEAINQLFDLGVVLVASAGNQSSFHSPNFLAYGYPASYDHVISVTTVHAKNHDFLDELTGPIPIYGYISNYNEDVICVNGGIGFDLNNPVFIPFYEWSTSTNARVDICGPAYGPQYSHFLLGCSGLYGDTTSISAPFVSGTVGLMQSLNPCILPGEVEDVLQLSSKNLEIKPENVNFIGRSGSGKLETGDAVEFTHEMMSSAGVALIDGQDFWRFDFDLKHIFNGLVISNQKFRDQNTSNFTARNYIDVTENADFRPGSTGFVDLNIDSNLTVCAESSKTTVTTIERNDSLKIDKATLYPNPNKGSFSILLNRINAKDVDVTISDIFGKPIYQTKANQNEFVLNLPNLPTGLYIVKLSSNEINETLKFLKE